MAVISASKALQFRATLLGISPAIWRQIQVPARSTFWDLHVALQDAFGWQDCHLHMFHVGDLARGKGLEIGIPDPDVPLGPKNCVPGWEVKVATILQTPGDKARYEYDFGDGWEHELVLEAVVTRQKRRSYPHCLSGERACPPEDCGGVGGYERLLEILSDRKHEEYRSTLQWLGGRFDPARFSCQGVRFSDPKKRLKSLLAQ
jgi:pRiA4b ORF-3-like protein